MASRPSYADVRRYSKAVAKVADTAGRQLERTVMGLDLTDPDVVEFVREYVPELVDEYGVASAELGAQWYEWCREQELGGGYTAIVDRGAVGQQGSRDLTVSRRVDGALRSASDPLDLYAMLHGIVSDSVQRSASDAILSNLLDDYNAAYAAGDPMAEHIGYARVAHAGACAWCVMLASQGFHYATEWSATYRHGSLERYHPDCRCTVVPAWGDDHSIDGYDGDRCYEMYRDAKRALDSGDYSPELAERMRSEAARKGRDYGRYDRVLAVMRERYGLS